MKRSVVLAQQLIQTHEKVLGDYPNLRYILFVCASDKTIPVWLQREYDQVKKRTPENSEMFSRFDTVWDEWFCTIIELFRSVLEEADEKSRRARLLIIDNGLREGVEHMKVAGAVPKPFVPPGET